MPREAQLIVGRAGDDRRLEAWNGVVVEHPAEGAGREDIDLQIIDLVQGRGLGGEIRMRPVHQGGIDVGDEELRAGLAQIAAKRAPDVADALDGDLQPGEPVACELVPRGRLDAGKDAVSRDRRGVDEPGDVARDRSHHGHVIDRGADVFGDDVAPVQRVDAAAERPQKRRRLVGSRIGDDDRLAAALPGAG